MLDNEFRDQTIIITGAGGNLGAAVVRLFQESGASLVLLDYSEDSLQNAFPELVVSDQHLIFQGMDVNNTKKLESLIEQTVAKYSRIDVLVNTIGGFREGIPIHETTDSNWDLLFNLNARSVFTLSRAVIPIMKAAKSGKIVNIAARLGLKGAAGQAVYSAAKSSVIRLTESMAAELIDDDINVNCVLPGTIDTPQNRSAMPGAEFDRWVKPESIARVIRFLVSSDADAITGASIPVYGKS